MTMSMQHRHGHAMDMKIQHGYGRALDKYKQLFYVHAHVNAACPFPCCLYMSMLIVHVHVHVECSFMLYVYVHAVCLRSCCMFTFMLHVHAHAAQQRSLGGPLPPSSVGFIRAYCSIHAHANPSTISPPPFHGVVNSNFLRRFFLLVNFFHQGHVSFHCVTSKSN
jgi:hypothetical protein